MEAGDGLNLAVTELEEGGLSIALSGRLDSATTGRIWSDVVETVRKTPPDRLVVDAAGLTYLDGVGAGLLIELRRRLQDAGAAFELTGLSDDLRRIVDLFPVDRPEPAAPRRELDPISQIGKIVYEGLLDFRFQLAFIGEMTVELGRAIARPGRIRWRDTMRTLEQVGVDSVPVICIIGLLLGLILAFSFAAMAVKYGAVLYVADGVAYATFRELGPIMAAIILAGRSGSAFAAEIGTMKVNEEVDALTTMGLKPVGFLVVPRIIAAMIATPLLTLFMVLLALVGSALVILAYDYPTVTYVNRVVETIGPFDLGLCLFKGVVFGLLIAAVGCLRGLQTGKGAMSVGVSATRAVVTSIVLVIFVDGIMVVVIFAVGA